MDSETISVSELLDLNVEIIHYRGLARITSKGFVDYIISYTLRIPHIGIAWEDFKQFLYNQTNPFKQEKERILREVIKLSAESDDLFSNREFSSYSLMDRIYTKRWQGHPLGLKAHDKLELFLEAFVDSGELVKAQSYFSYIVKGKAINTLEEIDRENKKDRVSLIINIIMAIATVCIAIFTIVMAFKDNINNIFVDGTLI